MCVSLLVYGLLAWLMPQTYSNRLNAALDERVRAFLSELEQVAFSDSGGLFDQFISEMEINSVELYNSSGDWVSLPTKEFDNEWGVNNAQTAVAGLGETAPVLSNRYYFCFSDSNDRYTLVVYGEAQHISELQQSFIRILPIILLMVLMVSFAVSGLYYSPFSRSIRSAMHGFVTLEEAGFFGTMVDADESYFYMVKTLIQSLKAGHGGEDRR